MLITTSLRILCFGDSLTAGWSASTLPVMHPYAGNLELSLKAAFPPMNISKDVQGYPGDQTECPPGVCPGFLSRIEKLYQKPTDYEPYDWAIILGGTNDLNWGRDAPDIYTSLQKVWDIPLGHGTKVLALTVPECGGCEPLTDQRAKALNTLIMNHQGKNFYTFDLHDSVPYKSMPEKQRKIIWDDIIHFTPKGYDLVGSRIAERMVEILKDLDSASSTQDSTPGELKR